MGSVYTNKSSIPSLSSWWESLDMKDPYLCKLFSQMFGSTEQRIEQLYIIRNTMNFKTK